MRLVVYILHALISTAAFGVQADSAEELKPLPFEDCKSQYPEGLLGTWRLDHDRTDAKRLERLEKARFIEPPNIGERDASTITFTEKTIVFNHPWVGDITRTYSTNELSANRYKLKYQDSKGAKLEQDAELVPCGLILVQFSNCTASFCRNFEEESLRLLQPDTGSEYYEDSIAIKLKRRMQKNAEEDPEPIRAYYRKVTTPILQPSKISEN